MEGNQGMSKGLGENYHNQGKKFGVNFKGIWELQNVFAATLQEN